MVMERAEFFKKYVEVIRGHIRELPVESDFLAPTPSAYIRYAGYEASVWLEIDHIVRQSESERAAYLKYLAQILVVAYCKARFLAD